jgi:hypothetical protein
MTILEDKENNSCSCVGKHVPLPHKLVKVEVGIEHVYLCPTSYHNLLCLESEYARVKGVPPGNIRKHFSDYIQSLVQSRYEHTKSIRPSTTV